METYKMLWNKYRELEKLFHYFIKMKQLGGEFEKLCKEIGAVRKEILEEIEKVSGDDTLVTFLPYNGDLMIFAKKKRVMLELNPTKNL